MSLSVPSAVEEFSHAENAEDRSNSSPCRLARFLRESLCVKIHINGQPRDTMSPLSLSALIEELGMKSDRVAVELNRGIVPREQWAETSLSEGDRLEIVQFVGGG